MEIATQPRENGLEVKVRGRLDNYWAAHLQRNLEEVIRGGAHVIWLNLAEVFYLSSAGVGLLVKFHRQLQAIGGSFQITNPSEHVKTVVELCHLSPILLSGKSPETVAPQHKIDTRRFTTPGAVFELAESASKDEPLSCAAIGDPELLRGCRFGPEHCRAVKFPHISFGLGLGAFGDGFEDAKQRFGEFLAVCGAAAYLPTDGTNVADFMVSSGDLVPELHVLYGLKCEGGFTKFLRFESASSTNSVSMEELVRVALEISGAQAIGMVMMAESAGLVGAALRRSPVGSDGGEIALFQYPEIRSWITFSAERLYSRSLALVAGIAANPNCKLFSSLLRPLESEGAILGHFHAAAFSYRPLPKGEIDLNATVAALFETENLQGVLHLLADNREAAGPQQSEFVRGACWIGAVAQ